jgi:imidazolonepropionase-like amidohydrolase
MTSPSNHQQAIALLENLEDDRLPDAIAALEALNQPVRSVETAEEAALIGLINHRLPLVQRQRLAKMCEQLEVETLTEEERRELLEIAEAIEIQDAERARAMFELATLRGVDLAVIVQEFRDAIGRD